MSIAQSARSNTIAKRLKNLENHFTYSLYSNICRSLFEKDKLLFSFVLCATILKNNKEIPDDEFAFFLTGSLALGQEGPPNPNSDIINDRSWNELVSLSKLPAFNGLCENFDAVAWKPFIDKCYENSVFPPAPWEKPSDFHRLLLVRCLRPEKVTTSIRDFVLSKLGAKYTEPPSFDLHKSFGDSNCRIPLVFLLSPGVDTMTQYFSPI
jgi:dynein heavy chain